MRDNWQLFSGALPAEACENMIANFSKLPEVDGSTFNSDGGHRKSKVRWVHGEHNLAEHLLRYVNLANATSFNADIQQEMNEMQFGEYNAEYGGKYDWHHDVDWQNPKHFDRKISVVVQLSNPDSYDGGQFEFAEVESPAKEKWGKQGSVLIFPSYLQHRVKTVTNGVRYSLVSWVRGPRWR